MLWIGACFVCCVFFFLVRPPPMYSFSTPCVCGNQKVWYWVLAVSNISKGNGFIILHLDNLLSKFHVLQAGRDMRFLGLSMTACFCGGSIVLLVWQIFEFLKIYHSLEPEFFWSWLLLKFLSPELIHFCCMYYSFMQFPNWWCTRVRKFEVDFSSSQQCHKTNEMTLLVQKCHVFLLVLDWLKSLKNNN